jgi:pantoate--beta-alanine ligase
MSSRNIYLSAAERESALALPRAIVAARARVRAGVCDAQLLLAELAALISGHDNVEIEYLAIVDRHNLTAQPAIDDNSLLVMAVRVGQTRLIDNSLLLGKNGVN